MESENATEVFSKFQEMFNQMTTFNDQLRLKQEEHIHQLKSQGTIITDCFLKIEQHRTELNECESHLKQRKTNLEVKWKEMTKAIKEYNRRTKASRTPSEDQVERIENQVQQGLTQIQQLVDGFNNICTKQLDSFTKQATRKITTLERLTIEQQLNVETTFQAQ